MGRQKRRQEQRRAQRQQAVRHQTRQQRGGGGAGVGAFTLIAGAVIILAALVGLGFAAAGHLAGISATPTPSATSAATNKTVDGIQCSPGEMLQYHIHQHLTLYDHGRQVSVPADIGIPGGESFATCYYWIHVHENDPGIIHVESPNAKTYTLGNFFDIWKATASTAQPAGDAYVRKLQAAAKNGDVTVFVNGKPWHRSYRAVPLVQHAVITVEIGKPVVPPKPFTNWQGQ